GPLTHEVVAAAPLDACAPLTNPGEVAGNFALVVRGTCTFTEKHLAVQDAGAVGIIVFNNVPGDPITMGGESAGINFPGLMISLDDGTLILGALAAGETVTATISADHVIPNPELADLLTGSTPRGPG